MKVIVVSMQYLSDWDGNTKEFNKFIIAYPKYNDIIKEVEDAIFTPDGLIKTTFSCSELEDCMGYTMERVKVCDLYNNEGEVVIGKQLCYVAKDNSCKRLTLYVYNGVKESNI